MLVVSCAMESKPKSTPEQKERQELPSERSKHAKPENSSPSKLEKQKIKKESFKKKKKSNREIDSLKPKTAR